MSDAIRDVTIRVGVIGGKAEGLDKLGNQLSTADAYLKSIKADMKDVTAEAKLMKTATSEFAESMKEAAAVDLGDMGLGAAKTAIDEYTAAQKASVEAANEAATQQVEATKEVETAVKQEEKTATESAFKRIALSERLAAHQRKTKDEALKAEAEKSAAFKKASDDQRAQMLGASTAIAGALAAGTQFVSTIKLIAGESPEIEELARQFAQVQGVVAGIAAGTQAFNGLNQGLTSLQSAASAATAQLAATGGTATMTQTALIRLAPAAATAQAALGPIGLAIAGISLAVAAVKAASDYFSNEMPDDSDRNARAYERVNNQLAEMKRKLDSNARSMEAQNRMLQVEFDLRQKIAGETTISDIDEQVNKDIKAASDQANTATATEQNEAAKRLAALQDELTPQALTEAQGAEGLGATLTPETIRDYSAAIQQLPEEQRSVYEETLSKFEESLKNSLSSATDELQSKLRDNEQALKDNKRSVDDATKAYQDEQNTALRLQASPAERKALEQSVTEATATGNLYSGIDALSGVVSSEREQQLRNQLAQGNLTRQKLLEEIADAAEFETEKAALEAQVATLNKQADALDATRDQLTKAQKRVEERMTKLSEDIAATQMAQQAR